MRDKVIQKYEGFIDRQIQYFIDYLKVLYFEDIDIQNNKFEDLKLHLDIETDILKKIIQLSKIINSLVMEFKIKDIEKNSTLLKKQEKLEELKIEALECNQKNQQLLKSKQLEIPKPLRPKGLPVFGSKNMDEPAQIFSFIG